MTDTQTATAIVAATGRLLVALDFDGTLAPLQNEPMQARMLPAARDAVDALIASPATVVALVSGRSLADLRLIAEHDDDSAIWLAGSHGAEFWAPGHGALPTTDDVADEALRDVLRAHAEHACADMTGIWIEPKTFGFGVHTRRADDVTAEAAYRAVDAIVAEEAPTWRRRTGRNIVEYAFRHEGKDTAVAQLRRRTDATAVLFAGDDVTDEDALTSLRPGDLGVHVGPGPTDATVLVPDIAAMADLLDAIARMRSAPRE